MTLIYAHLETNHSLLHRRDESCEPDIKKRSPYYPNTMNVFLYLQRQREPEVGALDELSVRKLSNRLVKSSIIVLADYDMSVRIKPDYKQLNKHWQCNGWYSQNIETTNRVGTIKCQTAVEVTRDTSS